MELTEGLKELILQRDTLSTTKSTGPWEERPWFNPFVFIAPKTLFWLEWLTGCRIKWVARVPMPPSEKYYRFMFLGLKDGLSLNGRRGTFTILPRLLRRAFGERFIRAGFFEDMPKNQQWLVVDIQDPYVFTEDLTEEMWNTLMEYYMTMSIQPIYEPDKITPYLILQEYRPQKDFITSITKRRVSKF